MTVGDRADAVFLGLDDGLYDGLDDAADDRTEEGSGE